MMLPVLVCASGRRGLAHISRKLDLRPSPLMLVMYILAFGFAETKYSWVRGFGLEDDPGRFCRLLT